MTTARIYPVIHILNEQQVIRNIEIANDANADGVFLINHNSSVDDLIRLSMTAKGLTSWVGINCLGYSALEAMKVVPPWVDGLWADNAEINVDEERRRAAGQSQALKIREEQKQRSWLGTYFGGVAFKYQKSVDDVAKAAKVASEYMDVVTTSGPGTGKAANIDKIKKMWEAMLPGSRLAIASGITPENIELYLPYATDFLVATGISHDFYNLDSTKLHLLMAATYDCGN